MSPDAAKAVARAMTGLWQGEYPATMRVLSAMKDEGRDYKPHDKSRSAWQLATHIATSDLWFLDCIEKGAFVFDPEKAKAAEAQFKSVADIVAFYEKMIPPAVARFNDMSGEALAETVDFFGMMQMPRAQWIGFANNHGVHHRGQLSAYLRNMGCKVPDIYGPSGDAEPAPAT